MSGRKPARPSDDGAIIDAFEFARDGARLTRSTPIAQLARLAAGLQGDDPAAGGAVDWTADGSVGTTPEGRHALWLDLQLRLAAPMQCMRCLETVVLPIEAQRRFKLERDAGAVDAEPLDQDLYDSVLGSDRFDLLELLEDEALLALPFAPMHAQCALPRDAPAHADEPAKSNPFAALVALKRPPGATS